MKIIKVTEFDEIIMKDEDLTAKAKAIAELEDEKEKGEKLMAFAESLGYTLKVADEPVELDVSDLDDVTGGKARVEDCITCTHTNEVFEKEVPGFLWGGGTKSFDVQLVDGLLL